MSSLFYEGDYAEGSYLFTSSEGEGIKANLGRKSSTYSEFIQNGYVNDREYRFFRAFRGDDENTIDVIECPDRVFLFDAVDSGLSVDSVVEVKGLFDLMLNDHKGTGKNIYIIIAANEYELARNADCFDVNAGKYIRFKDYEEYRTFIIKSRQAKEKRIDRQEKWREAKRQKEIKAYYELKERENKLLEEFKASHDMDNLSWSDQHRLEDIQRITKDFLRHSARYIRQSDIDEIENKNS